MEHVAARAGVSRALVSIVFRGVAGASEATRERVLAAARELDYRPDTRASRLGSSRTRTLGVTFSVGHAFHGDLLESLYTHADAAAYELVLSGVTPSRSEGAAVETLLAERCEGIVLLGSSQSTAQLARLATRVPVVSVLRPGARRRGRRRAHRRRRRPAARGRAPARPRPHAASPCSTAVARRARPSGGAATARRCAARRGSPRCVLPGGPQRARGGRGGAGVPRPRRRASGPPPSRPSTTGAPSASSTSSGRRGSGCPSDVSVVGFDDITEAGYPHVALTTVRQDAERLGAEAVRSLADRLDGESPPSTPPPGPSSSSPSSSCGPARHRRASRTRTREAATCRPRRRVGRARAVHERAGPGRAVAGPRRATPPARTPLVVVLPGLGLPFYTLPTARALVARGLDGTVLDLPGFGSSLSAADAPDASTPSG